MRGDFSTWRDESLENFNGVLHQQGRVLNESDMNAQTRILNDWQDTAGRDIIGAGVAAVPSDSPQGFKVKQASIINTLQGDQVELTLAVGRAWVDGLLVRLFGPNPTDAQVARIATYLQPPLQDPPGTIPVNPPNSPLLRDAVVLEVWREEINAFQLPGLLIEPALGGVDTTERVHTATAFKLRRLADDETCESIIPSLQDNFDNKGKLTVSLQPTNVTDGDCPVAEGGGYTGFEHNLYRIEVAEVNTGLPAMFKWSQFNGGLVGRGLFDVANQEVTVTANLPATLHSGLNAFYLEALEYDPSPIGNLGHWRVTYGARVTLDSNGNLTLPNAGSADELFGSIPTTAGTIFFRLWNGIEEIADFTAATELQDGIILQFEPDAVGRYTPKDYWTFSVRAGEIANNQTLINNQPPEGIHYHRAPLGILTWTSNTLTDATSDIEDCRHIFPPLTKLSTCCAYRVGDGTRSHGDFTSIQEAINHLPANGGEICILPGVYTENIRIHRRRNITLKGCGPRSRIVFETDDPVIHVLESQRIKIESLGIRAHTDGVGILLEGPEQVFDANDEDRARFLQSVTLEKLYIQAARRSAIECHVGSFITIRDNNIAIFDLRTEWAAVYFAGDDSLIENNLIQVLADDRFFNQTLIPEPVVDDGLFRAASSARGGLHLGGGCDRVRVINNLINGGIGDGITLGSVDEETEDGRVIVIHIPWWPGGRHDNGDCNPNPGFIDVTIVIPGRTRMIAGAPLNDIWIERNRIYNMGRNGIGVDAFFDLRGIDEFISVENLTIRGNRIRRCLNRPIPDIPTNMVFSMGYGGIALADVENLVVQDNFITDNGPNHLEPVCGIFVLHGEGVDISRNRILNNGARTRADVEGAERGRRGGIVINFGVAPQVETFSQRDNDNQGFSIPLSNGVPAIKIHENIVSVPLGQALSLIALGPVSVVGNQFTSLGISQQFSSLSLIAGAVLIFNLGLSNELWLQALSFRSVKQGTINPSGNLSSSYLSNSNAAEARAGLDDFRLGRYLANGNVLFSNNQCQLNLLERGTSFALTSILIFSLDDIGFHCNQCDCDLFDDFVFVHAFLFGISLRASDNRFKEGLLNALLSAMTFGWLNATTDNESTHCLLIRGRLILNKHNLVLLDSFFFAGEVDKLQESICNRARRIQSDFGKGNYVAGAQPVNG
jgi:hypothetical protein